MNNKFINVFKKKWLRDNTKTTVLVIIILALYIGITYWMNNTTFPELDLTASKIYSLSSESIAKIKDIDREVKITFVNFGGYGYVIDFARKYGLENKNILVEVVEDIAKRPDLVQKYGLQEGQDLIIVSSGENEDTLYSYELYTYDYNTYEQIDRTEEAFTNAILNVSTDEKPKIYFMTGHNLYPIESFNTVITKMKSNANEVSTIDLFTLDKVPEDCDIFVITSLAQDITEKERDALLSYIKNGGNLLVFSDPQIFTGVSTPNLDMVLAEFGASVSDGIIIEQNSGHMVAGSPEFIVEDVMPNGTLNQNIDTELKICTIYSGMIELADETKLAELGVEYENFVITSKDVFLREDKNDMTFTKKSTDADVGVSPVASLLTKRLENDKNSKLIVFASSLLISDIPISAGIYQFVPSSLYNNMDIVLNSIAYLTEKENLITIRKSYSPVSYTVTELQNNIILLIIVSVPLYIILVGIVVWRIRRRKR